MEKASYKELAKEFIKLKDKLARAEERAKQAREEFDHLRKHVIPARMEEDGMTSIRLAGVGTLKIVNDAYVSTKSGEREHLLEWVRSIGGEDIVTETVNSSTLKAFIKERVAGGESFPDTIINYAPYQYASVVKS
jgi:hypothetical protein